MSRALAEIGIGAALIGLDFLLPGVGIALSSSMQSFLISTGASMVLTGVGTLMQGQPQGGIAAASRNAIQPWNVIYGRAKIGGTIIYLEETGDDNKYLHMVIVLACHSCESVDTLLFDNQPVLLDGSGNSYSPTQQQINITTISRTNGVVTVTLTSPLTVQIDGQQLQIANVSDHSFNGIYQVTITGAQSFTYICGGNDGSSSGGYVKTTLPDYADKVHMEVLLGNHSSTFGGLIANSNGLWTAQHLLMGRTAVYIQLHYNDTIFANGLPNIAFILRGKNDIFDPRTNDYAYTENAALCIADFLAHPQFGFDCVYGTEIPIIPLISAANICDEAMPLAQGGTEARYTCNGTFTLARKRGEILQNLLTSCGGRLIFSSGKFTIVPAAWIGPSVTVGEGSGVSVPSSTDSTNMLINADGLVVNAYNNQAGRGDYFDQASGTSEGQFLLALGLLDAYSATSNPSALTLANKLLGPIIPVMYRGKQPPSAVTRTDSWAPHWLFTVKGPITSCKIHYDRLFAFTSGVAIIPDGGFSTVLKSTAPAFATTGVHVRTMLAGTSGVYNATSSTTILSEQDVPGLMFNTHPKAILPGDPHDSGNQASPMVNNAVDSLGRYAGDTQIANGVGLFSLALTGSFIVTQPGNITFAAYVNSTYIIGVKGASYVSGDRYIGSYTNTPFENYSVLAGLLDLGVWNSEKQGAWGALSIFTLNFPAMGIYPYEIGFAAGLFHEKQFCLLANNTAIPLVNEADVVSLVANGQVHNVFQACSAGFQLLWQNPYSVLKSGTSYPIASAVYDVGSNGTVVTLTDTSVNGSLGIIYSTHDGPSIPISTPYEAWPDWRALDAGEIDAACDTFNWGLRTFQQAAAITGDPLWKAAATATAAQMTLAYAEDDQRDWIARSWSGDPFSDGARFQYSSRAPTPSFSCDTRGNVIIDFNGTFFPGESQYGEASVGDVYASGDSTEILVGSSIAMMLGVFIDVTNQTPYNDLNRYRAALTLSGNGQQTFTLTLASFENNAGTTLAAGSPVYAVGIDDANPAPHTLTLGYIRQLPNVSMRYAPGGFIPFTSNYQNGIQISWRGPAYAGYQSPWAIKQLGNETNVGINVQFLADSQSHYSSMTGQGTGPFAPVYIPDRKDSVTYGSGDTWTWSGPDPNTKWGGYQYRPLKELAYLILACTGSESYYSLAVSITNNFLSWLDSHWTSGGPPTDYVEGAAQTNGDEPHFAAQILHTALLMDTAVRPNGNASGTINSTYSSLITKAFNYLGTLYRTSGTMAGTFSPDVANLLWFGFWHGEIMRALAYLIGWSTRIGDSVKLAQAELWINGMSTYAGIAQPPTATRPARALADVVGGFQWKQTVSSRDLFNGVKGVYVSPANKWEQADIPPYAQDEKHGYSNGPASAFHDANLAQDLGQRLWKDIQLPFTISSATAQRLCKIELMKCRQQGTGTFPFSMRMYQITALDVVAFTLPALGWVQKLFEISNFRLTYNKQNQSGKEAVLLGTELDLQETDPNLYDWSVTEELTPQGYQQSVLPDTTHPEPPVALTLTSGSSTVVTGADGLKRSRVMVTWSPPPDAYVMQGGHIEIQYQIDGDSAWTGLAKVDPVITTYYITAVNDGEQINVQIRSVNCAGYPSDWVQAGPETVSDTFSTITTQALPSTVSVNGVSI
jgi:hypothetical protein